MSTGAPVGRPRRLEPDTERRRILDSALSVMRRNGYADAGVADILEHAGLSTRSFYRQFGSKDELLCDLYRREGERAVARLAARVEAESSPLDALTAWIDEMLSFRFDRRKAERVAVLGSQAARRAVGYDEVMEEINAQLIAPLVDVLARGKADGTFPSAEPLIDAPAIHAVAAAIAQRADSDLDQPAALQHALRFCLPALRG